MIEVDNLVKHYRAGDGSVVRAVDGISLAVAPGDRPLLLGADFAEEAALLSERRMPAYRSLADATVGTEGDTAATLERLLNAIAREDGPGANR